MNSRYLIVFLLLGGVVYGFTTMVGGMLWVEQDPVSAYSSLVEWSQVPAVETPSRRGGSSFPVPVSSRTASLFRHPAVYSVPMPQGYASANRPVYAAASSAYPVARGLHLTSSATLQSYGGGMENVAYSSAGKHSAISSASSLSGNSVSTLVSTHVSLSLSPVVSPSMSAAARSSYAFAASSAAMPYTSSQQQSAPRRNGVRRTPGTIGTTLDNWLQGLEHSGSYWYGEEDGVWYFYENELKALYESAVANGDLPIGTTWEQFLKWFAGQSSKYQFYNAPLPDGIGVLCLFALLYAGVQLLEYHKRVVS